MRGEMSSSLRRSSCVLDMISLALSITCLECSFSSREYSCWFFACMGLPFLAANPYCDAAIAVAETAGGSFAEETLSCFL